MSLKDKLANGLAGAVLSHPRIRAAARNFFGQKYFAELNLTVAIGRGLSAPICYSDSLASFSEVFVQQEYDFIDRESLGLARWLDFGANNGYFSLYLAGLHLARSQHPAVEALLIDADPRSSSAMQEILRCNPGLNFAFRHGAAGAQGASVQFDPLPWMQAKIVDSREASGTSVSVPVIKEAVILAEFPPPYGLVKVDIEGAEADFLDQFSSVLSGTDFLIVEWHSWNSQKLTKAAFVQRLNDKGFARVREVRGLENIRSGKLSGACAVFACNRS